MPALVGAAQFAILVGGTFRPLRRCGRQADIAGERLCCMHPTVSYDLPLNVRSWRTSVRKTKPCGTAWRDDGNAVPN